MSDFGGGGSPPKPSRRRSGILIATIGVASCLGILGLASTEPTSDRATHPASTATAVTVQEIRMADHYDKRVSFVGRVEAARTSQLSFERAGLIEAVLVEEGDSVAPNQTLARLDTEELVADRAVRQARLEAAEAQLDELIAGPRQETIEAQRAEVSRLLAELKRSELRRDRQIKLLPQSATSQDAHDDAFYTAKSVQAALEAAKVQLKELERGTRQERISSQRAVVRQIEAEIESIDVDIRKSSLTAPFAGTIAERFADEGRVVGPGDFVVDLLEVSRLEVRLGVDSTTASHCRVGDTLEVLISGERIGGTIKAIRSDIASQTRTVDLLISLDCRGDCSCDAIRSGDLARVAFDIRSESVGAWVPIGALTEGGRGLWSLFVVTDQHADAGHSSSYIVERRDVEILHPAIDRSFVRGAIRAGEPIVVSGTHRLVPGQAVLPQTNADALVARGPQR